MDLTPLHPTTEIEKNRSLPRLNDKSGARSSRFKPTRIRGGMASDTVIQDRADRY